MTDFGRHGVHVQMCRRIARYCRAMLCLLEALRGRPGVDCDVLQQWIAAFRTLEAEASMLLERLAHGLGQPSWIDHLVGRAEPLFREFRRFARAVGISGSGEEEAFNVVDRDQPVPIGEHRLPPLPYPYDALEPYIDELTMRVHHDKHHQSYVDGLNKAELMMADARQSGNFDLIKHWEREAAFNGAGHYLHTLFWLIMNPQGGGEPDGPLAEAIGRDFGSFDAFQQHFSAAAEKVEGGGWALLVWAPRAQRLEILTAEKHQNLSQWDVIPLLALDVWEHAYYLKHQNDRKAYIRDWWNVVHWPEASRRYQIAQLVRWEPF